MLVLLNWCFFTSFQLRPLPAIKGGNRKFLVETKVTPGSSSRLLSRVLTTTSEPTTSTPTTTRPSTTARATTAWAARRGSTSSAARLFDLSCDEAVCSADSFCINDYDRGGSRCHCNLGKGGDMCEEGGFLCAHCCWLLFCLGQGQNQPMCALGTASWV